MGDIFPKYIRDLLELDITNTYSPIRYEVMTNATINEDTIVMPISFKDYNSENVANEINERSIEKSAIEKRERMMYKNTKQKFKHLSEVKMTLLNEFEDLIRIDVNGNLYYKDNELLSAAGDIHRMPELGIFVGVPTGTILSDYRYSMLLADIRQKNAFNVFEEVKELVERKLGKFGNVNVVSEDVMFVCVHNNSCDNEDCVTFKIVKDGYKYKLTSGSFNANKRVLLDMDVNDKDDCKEFIDVIDLCICNSFNFIQLPFKIDDMI